jgi:hypothetical protein
VVSVSRACGQQPIEQRAERLALSLDHDSLRNIP